MSIKSMRVYRIDCDDCGKTLQWPAHPFDFTNESRDEVMRAAKRAGWWKGKVPYTYINIEFAVFCPDCKDKRGIK